jgi:hypothetical protein
MVPRVLFRLRWKLEMVRNLRKIFERELFSEAGFFRGARKTAG